MRKPRHLYLLLLDEAQAARLQEEMQALIDLSVTPSAIHLGKSVLRQMRRYRFKAGTPKGEGQLLVRAAVAAKAAP